MKLEINNIEYKDFLSAKASLRIDALSDVFAFTAASQNGVPLPFSGGESCRVYVDNQIVITGFIEIVSVNGDTEGHTIEIEGRDKTGDLLDSSIGKLGDLGKVTITLQAICQLVIKNIGAKILVIDKAFPAPFIAPKDLSAPEPGQNAFDFLETIAKKRQVLLSSDEFGNLVLTRASGIPSGGVLQNLVNSPTNNVLQYAMSNDTTGRFNKYLITSQLNPLAINFAGLIPNLVTVNQEGFSIDAEVRAGRQLALIAEASGSGTDGTFRANWESNIRRARGKVYSVVVNGYRNQSGQLWTPNTLVQVLDEFVKINTIMLINTVAFTLDLNGGQLTSLSLVDKNTYKIGFQEPIKADKITNAISLS